MSGPASRDTGATVTLRTNSAEHTRAVGEALGRLLLPGDVVLLQGDLGAGKTTLTQGIARGAGTDEVVNSPTFILMNEYRGRVLVYHADLYRLERPAEVAALDLSGQTVDGALVVEWPERGMESLPAEHLLIELRHLSPDERALRVVPRGARPEALAQALSLACAAS